LPLSFLVFEHVLLPAFRPKAASAERVANCLARRLQRSRLCGDSVKTKQMALFIEDEHKQ